MSLRAATLYLLRYSEGEIIPFAAGSENQTTATMTNTGLPQVCDAKFAYDLSDSTLVNAAAPISATSRLVLAIRLVSFDGKAAWKAQSSIERTISSFGLDFTANSANDWTLKVMRKFRAMGLIKYSDNSLERAFSRANDEYNAVGAFVTKNIDSPEFQ